MDDEDEGVIITTTVKQNSNTQQTPSQNKYSASRNSESKQGESGTSSGIPSYHMQRDLQVSAQLTKSLFDTIKKGDLEAAKREQAKLGISLGHLQDEGYKQNAMFYAVQIKDEQ